MRAKTEREWEMIRRSFELLAKAKELLSEPIPTVRQNRTKARPLCHNFNRTMGYRPICSGVTGFRLCPYASVAERPRAPA